MKTKWLYKRDYKTLTECYKDAKQYKALGYRVFIQGCSAMDCKEYESSSQIN